MNFTLLVVTLVMIHVYLVAAAPEKGQSSNKRQKTSGPYGCQIVEKPAVEDKGKEEHIVCKKENKKLGGLYYVKDENTKTITIELINVHEDYRREGIGKYLLDYFLNDIAKAGGFKTIKLTVEDEEGNGRANTAAVEFYKKNGFTFDKPNDKNDGNMTLTLRNAK